MIVISGLKCVMFRSGLLIEASLSAVYFYELNAVRRPYRGELTSTLLHRALT